MRDQLILDSTSGQLGLFDDTSETYEAFTEKFKVKKTTDDCYTPENVHDAVADWTNPGRDPGDLLGRAVLSVTHERAGAEGQLEMAF